MAVWIFPKKIESIASISRKMMGVSWHIWIVSCMICGRDFPQDDDPPRWRSGLPPQENFMRLKGNAKSNTTLIKVWKSAFQQVFHFGHDLEFPRKNGPSRRHSVFFFGGTGGGWAQRQASADLVGGYRHAGEGWWDAGHFWWARGRAVRFFHHSSLKTIQVLRWHLDDFPTELSDTVIAG